MFNILEDITTNVDGEFSPSVVADASAFLTLVYRFDLIVALVITRQALDAIHGC